MEPPWDGGTKVCSNRPGNMTKMAAMPEYGKSLKKLLRNQMPMTLKVGMQHRVLEYYQGCSNDEPELTLTYLRQCQNCVPYAFVCEKR